MKTLVRITKVEDNIVYYKEICRKTGKTMIEDCMQVSRFESALQGEYGFKLTGAFECESGDQKGMIFYITKILKASVEITAMKPTIVADVNLGHEVRKIRFDVNTGDYYAVGFRRSMIFSKV